MVRYLLLTMAVVAPGVDDRLGSERTSRSRTTASPSGEVLK